MRPILGTSQGIVRITIVWYSFNVQSRKSASAALYCINVWWTKFSLILKSREASLLVNFVYGAKLIRYVYGFHAFGKRNLAVEEVADKDVKRPRR